MRRGVLGVVLLTLLAATVTACGNDDLGPPAFRPPLGTTTHRVTIEGEPHPYLLHVPESLAGHQIADVPLLVALHDDGGAPERFATTAGLIDLSDRRGFVLAVPRDPTVDDLDLVVEVIHDVVHLAPVGPVYVAGHGTGGELAFRAACEDTDQVDGVAVVNAQLVTSPCHPSRAIPLVLIHGDEDPVDDVDGLTDSMLVWASEMDCQRAVRQTEPGLRTVQWLGCRGNVRTESIVVVGAGHDWPTGAEVGFDAGARLWEDLQSAAPSGA